MFHAVHSWTSRLSGARADDHMLLALSGAEEGAGDARLRNCLEQLRRVLVARRHVELCHARAVAVGRGGGRAEDIVKERVIAGVSRGRQLEVLSEDHLSAMVRLMGVHEAFAGATARLRRASLSQREVGDLLSLCAAEEAAYQALLGRYPQDRERLERLMSRWQTLGGGVRRAA